ncbi:MAG: thioredoxin-dependent thiol peroxidase [Candidatus Moranbacteria bacterium]|nr:thioredoxin-dependent thiol peroxidase [Candidatus Moranbacteria bacterium]
MKKVGTKAPVFKAPDQDGVVRSLKDYAGKWVILYFYPKDDTPGCTKEACGFRDGFAKYKRAGIEIIGVSVDSVKKHVKFVEKYSLPFTLLSDEDKKIVEAYGVWGEKKFMGRTYMGTNRVSYLINPEGKIAKVYDKVKPEDHADEVLADVKGLSKK